ncbi:MAG: hypothetical protein HY271_19495 [Deltaproteobacteria bacterium]|nr:hypothetical protein [Deltaproteobacteria bacterium]
MTPQGAYARRAGNPETNRGLVVDRAILAVRVRMRRAVTTDELRESLELFGTAVLRTLQPLRLVIAAGNGAYRARLRPGKLTAVECRSDARQRVESRRDPCRQRAPRNAETLARVVAQPHEAETMIPATREQLVRSPPDLAPSRGFAATRDT